LSRPRCRNRSSIVSSSRCFDWPSTRRALNSARTLKAWVGELETERVLPVDPRPHGLGGLAVGELLQKLQNRHQRQAPRREGGLAALRVEPAEVRIPVELAELVPQPHHDRSLGKGSASNTNGLGRDLADRLRMKTHGSPHKRNKPSAFGGELGRADLWTNQGRQYHPEPDQVPMTPTGHSTTARISLIALAPS